METKKATDNTSVAQNITRKNYNKKVLYVKDFSLNELRDRLKQISYEELCNHGFLQHAKKSGYVCPKCGNGSGEDGTGIEEHIENNGVFTSKCHKCGENFDNIKILAKHFGLNHKTDFIEIIKRGASELLNEEFETVADSFDLELRNLILKDIAESQKNLSAFVKNQGGSWRGLTFDTLNFFRCGYLENWKHPQNIVKGKKVEFSRRVIIPAGSNYNAIALNEDRYIIPKNCWKMSTGKELFGLDLLHKNIEVLAIVEGEIDAMSIYQATNGNVGSSYARRSVNGSLVTDMESSVLDRVLLDALIEKAATLSPKHGEIFKMMLDGETQQAIADKLNMKQRTVADWVKVIRKTLAPILK